MHLKHTTHKPKLDKHVKAFHNKKIDKQQD